MFGGLGRQQNNGATCSAWWNNLQIGYKYLLIATMSIGILSIFINIFAFIFANAMVYTIQKFQIWRLITSFLVDQSIISVLLNVYLLSMYLPQIEKLYSTAYILLEIIIQNLLCNTVLYALALPLVLFDVINPMSVISYGMTPLLMIFMWQTAAMNPEQASRFCFFPCLIPMKYMPWCFFAFFVLFGGGNFAIYIGCLLGYYQYMIRHSSLLKLPMSFYKKIQDLLPKTTKQSPGFVKINAVQANLKALCRQATTSQLQQRNPFENNNVVNDRVEVEVSGKGVAIGSSSPTEPSRVTDYRSHWLKEQAPQQKQKEQKKQAPAVLSQEKPNIFQESQRNLIDVNNLLNQSTISNNPFLPQSSSEAEIKKYKN